MIDSKELRLDNLVSFKGFWNGRVSGLYSSGAIRIKDNDGFFDTESIRPILLTPEILEKCGFTHKILGDEEIDGGESHYILNDIWFCHDDDEWFLSGAIKHKPFKHLHQLQNLYFALTGNELNCQL